MSNFMKVRCNIIMFKWLGTSENDKCLALTISYILNIIIKTFMVSKGSSDL